MTSTQPHDGIRDVQRQLAAAGFDPGKADGLYGQRTRTALADALRKAGGAAADPNPQVIHPSNASAVLAVIGEGMQLLPAIRRTADADQLLLTISGQEADFRHRWQVHDPKRPDSMGAARGLWQFERGGGVKGVLTHERTRAMAAQVCAMRGLAPTIDAVYSALHRDDILAAAFARLLCWSSPASIPALGDVEAAWKFYLREWRPGAYTNGSTAQREALRAKWARYYAAALEARRASA